jgi:crotonobetainyl-CoA:carnitine CoA-transferase CaiB-like acyl-CoA transferase
MGIDPIEQMKSHPSLIWVSATWFGRRGPRARDPATDLTLSAGGGPVWSSGYDDHTIPPIRGEGYQTGNLGAMYTVVVTLAAVSYRRRTGRGQLVEVNVNAATNVSAEASQYEWLVAKKEVFRQTGRHAKVGQPSPPVQVLCSDGRYATTGTLPRTPRQFQVLVDWLEELDLFDDVPEAFFLKLAAEGANSAPTNVERDRDPISAAAFGAAREALFVIASHLPAQEFFTGGQRRGITVAAVFSPEEAFENEHFVARGFQETVVHEELDREIRYPGAPFKMQKSPWRIASRPPLLGEHNEEVLAGLADRWADVAGKAEVVADDDRAE